MAFSASFSASPLPSPNPSASPSLRRHPLPSSSLRPRLPAPSSSSPSISLHRRRSPLILFVTSAGDNVETAHGGEDHIETAHGGGGGNDGGFGGSGGGGGGDGGDSAGDQNKKEAMMVLAEARRSLDSLPKDLAAAIQAGRIPGEVVERFLGLEKQGFLNWLMQFGGFKERLLADELFLGKIWIECGIGLFTKTAAEYNQRKENFWKELEIVCCDVVMAIIADFMLVYLPAPTVPLRPPLLNTAGPIAKFFYNCPDNAFQIALAGTNYSLLQRVGSIVRNGGKLLAVGTTASLVGTSITNAFINAKKAVDKDAAGEVENVPILSTCAAYGFYMAVSSNLRYQILAGVLEQRILEPLLHNQKNLLSAVCFVVRTGNTYLGSCLWVDYARLIGLQKKREEPEALAA